LLVGAELDLLAPVHRHSFRTYWTRRWS